MRQGGGISGFAMRSESEYDRLRRGPRVDVGLGRARHGAWRAICAAATKPSSRCIGDGALTGGLAYEALNNAGQLKTNFIVILNDNEMSIAPNVGSIASYLSVLRTKPFANFAREKAKDVLEHMPVRRRPRARRFDAAEIGGDALRRAAKKAAVIFEELGFRYMGPIDGHNYDTLVDASRTRARSPGPVLAARAHRQGQGLRAGRAETRAPSTASRPRSTLENGKIEFKPGAPPDVLRRFRRRADRRRRARSARHRDHRRDARRHEAREVRQDVSRTRYFDVGIAEAHAVCFAAGAATSGTASRSARSTRRSCSAPTTRSCTTSCVQNLPVVFCMDRAGFVGDDGPTHMGLYDIAYLRTLPNMTVMAPRNEDELLPMLDARALARRAGRDSLSARHHQRQAPSRSGRADRARARPRCCAAAAASRSWRSATRSTSRSTRTTLLRESTATAADGRQRALRASRSTRRCLLELARRPRAASSRWRSTRSPAASARRSSSCCRDRGLGVRGRARRRARTCSCSTTRNPSSARSSAFRARRRARISALRSGSVARARRTRPSAIRRYVDDLVSSPRSCRRDDAPFARPTAAGRRAEPARDHFASMLQQTAASVAAADAAGSARPWLTHTLAGAFRPRGRLAGRAARDPDDETRGLYRHDRRPRRVAPTADGSASKSRSSASPASSRSCFVVFGFARLASRGI